MLRVIVGLIKGAVVGGGVAYGLLRLGLGAPSSLVAYLACGVVGALVGVVAGRAPWKAETIWTPVLKMVFGAGIGAGLAWLGLHFLPERSFTVSSLGAVSLASAPVLSLGVGLLYGLFVELDDGGDKGEPAPKKPKARAA